MATCRDVVTSAMKLAKSLSSGETPTADEADDGMKALQSLYDVWVTSGMFGRLEDVYLDGDDTAEEGKRYFVPTGVTLTAATSEIDGCCGVRQARDLAIYESLTQAGVRSVKLYDRTEWVEMTGLALSDTAPLSKRGEMGLAAALATSGGFAAMFGAGALMDGEVRGLAAQFIAGLSYKLGSSQGRIASDYY